jgi:uncharacterized protein (DUF58 family)
VIRRLDGLLQGDYRTLFRGFGLDLADIREYQYHDDVRPHRLERHRAVGHAVRAASTTRIAKSPRGSCSTCRRRSTSAPPDVRKRAVLADFVTVLARLLTKHGNRVGALFYGDGVEQVDTRASGRRHVLHILNTMLTRPPLKRAGHDQPAGLSADCVLR